MKLDKYFIDFVEEDGRHFPLDLQKAYMQFLVEITNYRDELHEEKRLPLDGYQYATSSINHIKTKIYEEFDKFFDPIDTFKKYYADEFDISDLNMFYDFLKKAEDEDVEHFYDWFEAGLLEGIGINAEIVNAIFKERERVTEEESFLRKVDLKRHLQLVEE